MLSKLPSQVFKTIQLIALVVAGYAVWLAAGKLALVLDSVIDLTEVVMRMFSRFLPERDTFDPVLVSLHYIAWAQAAFGGMAAFLKYRYYNQPDNHTRYLFNEVCSSWATFCAVVLLLPVVGIVCHLGELRTVLFSMFLAAVAVLSLVHVSPGVSLGANHKVMHVYMYISCITAVLSFIAMLLIELHKYPVSGMAEVLAASLLGILFARIHIYIHLDQVEKGQYRDVDDEA